MQIKKKLISVLIAVALLCSLVPAAYAAKNTSEKAASEASETTVKQSDKTTETADVEEDDDEDDSADVSEDELSEEDEEEDSVKEADTKEEAEEIPAAPELDSLIIVYEGELYYNDKETVFNNGGTVFNNGGTVYNNGGITYNNLGTVYNNGGTAYNNNGLVLNNGGIVYDNGGEVVESSIAGIYNITFEEDYSSFVTVDGLQEDADGACWIEADDVITIAALKGYIINDISLGSGEFNMDDEGVITISGIERSVKIGLTIQLEAPEFSVETGTYADKQSVKITSAPDTVIYYTTDGTDPDENSEKYSGAISVSEGMEIAAVACSENLQTSEIAHAAYAFAEYEAPKFETVDEGYKAIKAGSIIVSNPGTVDAVIDSVELKDTHDAFTLNSTKGGVVPAGETDEKTWTVRPKTGLEAATYSAEVIFTYDSGESVTVKVSFRVS